MFEIHWKYENEEKVSMRPFNEQRGANALFDQLTEVEGIEWVEFRVAVVRRFESKYRKKNIEVKNGGF